MDEWGTAGGACRPVCGHKVPPLKIFKNTPQSDISFCLEEAARSKSNKQKQYICSGLFSAADESIFGVFSDVCGSRTVCVQCF